MTKKEPKDWRCYWESDCSPVPKVTIEKEAVTRKAAETWLNKQVPSKHQTPKIGHIIVVKTNEKSFSLVVSDATTEEKEEDCECPK